MAKTPNWDAFIGVNSGNKESAFEALARELFKKKYDLCENLPYFKNQAGNETTPIRCGAEVVGFQAKFFMGRINTKNLIDSLKKARKYNQHQTCCIIYTNGAFGNPPKGETITKGQKTVEDEARNLGLKIEWQFGDNILDAVSKDQHLYDLFFNIEAKASNSVENLSSIINSSLIYSGFQPHIESITTTEDPCPIPKLYSLREAFVSKLKDKLAANYAIWIYGGIKEGKTILSCMVARSIVGYRIVRVPFLNENKLNLIQILENCNINEKIIFILDAVKYENPSYYEEFYRIILKKKSSKWFFIINSYDNISDFSLEPGNSIFAIQIPPLTLNEIKEMIPEEKQEPFGPFIFNLLNGQPLLTNIICGILEEKQWSPTIDELGELLQFPTGIKLESGTRTIVQNLISDGETYHLLNRLLFYGTDFTKEDCVELASIKPIITTPLSHLNNLLNVCVIEKDGAYHISDLLKKVLPIDMLPIEKKYCAYFIVDKILSNKTTSQIDILRAINLLCSSNCFDEAAGIYIYAILLLQKNSLLDNENFHILEAIWADLPLPETMSPDMQLSIRVVQLIILGEHRIKNPNYIENDIDRILSLYKSETEIKSVSLQTLVAYYAVNGQTQKVIKYRQQQDLCQGKTIKSTDILLVSLNNVNNENDLYDWFDLYENEGKPEYELLCDGAISAINKIFNSCPKENHTVILERICKTATKRDITNFAIAACSRLIDTFREQELFEKASSCFKAYCFLTETSFGSILLNYSYGLCLYYAGDMRNSELYVTRASKNDNIRIACMVSFYAASFLSQILGNKGETLAATNAVGKIVDNSDFERCYSEYEKACIYGTLAYAQWQSNQKEEAVTSLLKVECFLWNEHKNITDEYKSLSLRFDILALYMKNMIDNKNTDPDLLQPSYELFTSRYEINIHEYNPLRNFSVLYAVNYLVDMVLQDERTSITIIEHMSQIQKTDGVGAGYLLTALLEIFPMLLTNGRKDLLEYIVLCALADFNNIQLPENNMALLLISAIRSIVAYRVNCMAKGLEFDDDWMFCLIKKAQSYLNDRSKINVIVETMKAEVPNYDLIADPDDKTLVMIYNIEKMDVKNSLWILYHTCLFFDSIGRLPSLKKQIEIFAKSFVKVIIKTHPTRFNIDLKDFEEYFGQVKGRYGIDYVYEIMKGFYFKMNFEPYIDKTIENIVIG